MRSLAALFMLLAPVVAWSAPVIHGVSAHGSRGTARVLNPSASASYRTVVVFGDTQFAVQSGQAQKLTTFQAQIDWIIANKATENIDFVLHVGDIINEGSFLPVPNADCDGDIDGDFLTCFNTAAGAACTAEPGCYTTSQGDCYTCGAVVTTAAEWVTFDSVWSKLEPGAPGGLAEGVPFAIVRGNHDNIGVPVETERDTPGYNQLYDSAYWEALEASFNAVTPGIYNHVETRSTWPSEGDANVWKFQLGPEEVMVIGPSYEGGADVSQSQIDWVVSRFNQEPTIPGILLVHDTIQNGEIRRQTWDPPSGDPPVPSIFQSSAGHIGTNGNQQKALITNGVEIVLQTVTDWSRTTDETPSISDYVTLIRFYPDDAPDEAEAFDYSPQRDANHSLAANIITKQVFDILPTAQTGVPVPSFTATSTQATTNCFTPCVFYFDATATTDPQQAEPFRELRYDWDFGDSKGETWAQGAVFKNGGGWDKNVDIAPRAAHAYTSPGSFTVTLTVTDPDGGVASTSSVVTVADAQDATDVFCVSTSGVFTGCTSKGAGSNVTSSDWDDVLNTTVNADAAMANSTRVRFRCGETWTQDASVTPAAAAEGIVLDCYGGTGTRYSVDITLASLGVFGAGVGWTVADVDFDFGTTCNAPTDCNLIQGAAPTSAGFTLYNGSSSNHTHRCVGNSSTSSALAGPVAFVDWTCTHAGFEGPGNPNPQSGLFIGWAPFVMIGTDINSNYRGEFPIRSFGNNAFAGQAVAPLIAHSILQKEGTATTRNLIQMRGGYQYALIHDNYLPESQGPDFIRFCQDVSCGSQQDRENTDAIIQYNFFAGDAAVTGVDAFSRVFSGQVGRLDFRFNIIDFTGFAAGGGATLFNQEANEAGSVIDDGNRVFNNVWYSADTHSTNLTFCSSSTGTGHLCYNNLQYAPNNTGTDSDTSGAGWTAAGNVVAGSNPFAGGTPSVEGSSTPDEFQISDNASWADTGTTIDFPRRDFFLGCGPFNAPTATGGNLWDAGAHEFGTIPCVF